MRIKLVFSNCKRFLFGFIENNRPIDLQKCTDVNVHMMVHIVLLHYSKSHCSS